MKKMKKMLGMMLISLCLFLSACSNQTETTEQVVESETSEESVQTGSLITKDDIIRTGSEEVGKSGNDTDTTSVATFDSNNALNPERAVRTDYSSTDTTTYNSVKDAHTLDSQDRVTYGKSDQMVYGKVDTTNYGRKDETTYNSSNTETKNLVDEFLEMKIRQGNIGVTKSTDLVESELRLRDSWDHMVDYFIADFIRQYAVL